MATAKSRLVDIVSDVVGQSLYVDLTDEEVLELSKEIAERLINEPGFYDDSQDEKPGVGDARDDDSDRD